jgi:PAS domain S-box-containing protein
MNQPLSDIKDASFKSFIEKLDFGILKQGPQAEILISNTAALEMLGLSEEQLLGKTSFDPDWNVIHEDGSDFPGHTHPVSVSIATLKPVKNVVMGVSRPGLKDRVWLLVNADPELDASGKLLYVICTFNNISGQMNAMAMLGKSEAHFRKMFEASPVGISLTGINDRLFANTAFCNQTGYTKEELNNKSWIDITHPDDINITRDALELAKKQKGRQVRVEKRYIHKNGGIVYGDLWMVFNEDTNSYITNIFDITEKKKAEQDLIRLNTELKKSSEELSELSHHMQYLIEKERADLAREIHYEFAQKFAAIHMNAELIKQKLKTTAVDEAVSVLINDQISLSAEVIKSCKTLFNNLYPTQLQDIGLIAALESYAEGNLKLAGFSFELLTNIEKEVFSNEVNLVLYRIFMESMANILHYAKANHVTVSINKVRQSIRMVITDDGIGFNMSEVNNKEQHGLLVMRERTYAIKGQFSIYSVPGEGTCVEVIIPLA